LDRDRLGRIITHQLFRSGTSVGANVEEAQGGQSTKDFESKMQIARKEARETHYWLRMVKDSGLIPAARMSKIIDECEQIVKILTAIILSSKQNHDS
jgi:four helix bundle protein